MDESKYKIEPKDKWLEGMQRKHNTKQKDGDALKASPIKVKDLDYVNVPRKEHLIGNPGMTSVRKDKPQENPLHGGSGKDMS